MGEIAYNLLLQNESPGVVSPSCDFDRFAKYFRDLGQTMKDVKEWRH